MNVSVLGDTGNIHVSQIAAGENDTFGARLGPALQPHVYFFDAQRIPQSSYSFGRSSDLQSNASNLAEVLNVLQSSRTAFAEYVTQVARVIPAIKWVSVAPSPSQSQHVEIRIWNVSDATGRDDLAIPLAECGTGVGQVLSILYVRMRSTGNLIVIDEPNSFLHPRAAKALIGILKEDKSNQYVISTHSSEIIVASDPDRFFSLRFADEKTTVTEVARSDLSSVRQVLDELGSQLSDVFGADSVIWVEGPTEVQCFPMLLQAVGRSTDPGLAIAPLRSTGDLEGRHGRAVADIYRNLSAAGTILPRTLAVSLDGDKRDMKDQESLERAFGAKLHFLGRRCFDNYLLHPAAICAVLNSTPTFATAAIDSARVSEWIRVNGANEKFKPQGHEILSAGWLEAIDAPVLLDELFQSLSDAREIYRKPLHSVELTQWLLQNDADFLRELVLYVVALIPEYSSTEH